MKKTNSTTNIKKAILCISALCAFSYAASAPTLAAPPAGIDPALIQQGQSEVGGMYNDLNNLRYKTRDHGIGEDYQYYEERKKIERDPNAGNQLIKNDVPVPETQQATIEEIDTKGVFVNSIEVSPSEILTL